jgi:hypothetical protein
VIGDIGRVGGVQSINNGNPGCPILTGANAMPGVQYHGYNASVYGTGDNFGSLSTDDDVLGGFQSYLVASIMNTACAAGSACQAVFNTGDNLYQCGADDMYNPPGSPSRLQTDFMNIYQQPSPMTPLSKACPGTT